MGVLVVTVYEQCTMGRGGVETKVNQGARYWIWNLCDKILACLKKDPSCVRKHPEQHFLRHNLKFFLEFQKKNCFATSITFKITIKNYFLVKKVWKKKLPIKFAEKFCQKKVNQGVCYWVWNLCDKILACLKKDPGCFRKHPEQCFLRPDINFFQNFWKNFNSA